MKLIKTIISVSLALNLLLFSPLPIHAATSGCTTDSECNINNSFPGPGHFSGCYVLNPPLSTTSSPQPQYLCNLNSTSSTSNKPEGACGEGFVNTALGCISTNVESGGFINTLLQLAIGLGGIIALLLILGGVFIITTSAGIPDKLNQGKELITSAISGLLFIILSIFLLNLIGIKLLSIPGF